MLSITGDVNMFKILLCFFLATPALACKGHIKYMIGGVVSGAVAGLATMHGVGTYFWYQSYNERDDRQGDSTVKHLAMASLCEECVAGVFLASTIATTIIAILGEPLKPTAERARKAAMCLSGIAWILALAGVSTGAAAYHKESQEQRGYNLSVAKDLSIANVVLDLFPPAIFFFLRMVLEADTGGRNPRATQS